jgi:hypothetical protein
MLTGVCFGPPSPKWLLEGRKSFRRNPSRETTSRAREQVRSDLIDLILARLWPLDHRHSFAQQSGRSAAFSIGSIAFSKLIVSVNLACKS